MSAREPRFEVVRTDAGWFARFVAANGREIWRTSETYKRRRGAISAVSLIHGYDVAHYGSDEFAMTEHAGIEVREVDEREVTP